MKHFFMIVLLFWGIIFYIFIYQEVSADIVGGQQSDVCEDVDPILNDMRIPEDYEYRASGVYSAAGISPTHTSDYMYGNISVAIILPESNGSIDPNSEDWTQEEIDNVYAEIQDGLNWWITNKHPLAEVNFVIHEPLVLETSYEPITWPAIPDQEYWINETMGYLGYSFGSYFYQVRSYDNDLRTQDNTDWAFTIFVVDSSNDADGKFADNYFAYAYLQGPFMVMTYDNDGYGIGRMDAVTAHEAGHIFGADDEYGSCLCDTLSGFLQVENQNCDATLVCLSDVGCIMRGGSTPYANNDLEYYTEGQIGWRDEDEDDIIDCIDSTYNTDSDTDSDGIVNYWDSDDDDDSVLDDIDNCPLTSNPLQEDTDVDGIGTACDNCPINSNPTQEDIYPTGGNGIGDACECEGNFNCSEDQDVDGSDASLFKADFGRNLITDPCTTESPCNGDFSCNGNVDGSDAALFKQDFSRSSLQNPCPACVVVVEWCGY